MGKNRLEKNKGFLTILFSAFAVILLLGGCYSYPPAQVATEENTFSQKKKDRYAKLLVGVKVLTLLYFYSL